MVGGVVGARLSAGSFVPPAAIRELRDLTRYRKRLVQEHTAQCQRVQKDQKGRDQVELGRLRRARRVGEGALSGQRTPPISWLSFSKGVPRKMISLL